MTKLQYKGMTTNQPDTEPAQDRKSQKRAGRPVDFKALERLGEKLATEKARGVSQRELAAKYKIPRLTLRLALLLRDYKEWLQGNRDSDTK